MQCCSQASFTGSPRLSKTSSCEAPGSLLRGTGRYGYESLSAYSVILRLHLLAEGLRRVPLRDGLLGLILEYNACVYVHYLPPSDRTPRRALLELLQELVREDDPAVALPPCFICFFSFSVKRSVFLRCSCFSRFMTQ